MIYLVLALVALGVITAIGSKIANRHQLEETPIVEAEGCATCTGINDKCEQECMMEASVKPIVYYDDEELDRFQGRKADSYSPKEVEEFSEVMLTMQPSEVKEWSRSLILRGINMPNQLKDDFIALADDEHPSV